MAALLKDLYDAQFFSTLTKSLATVIPGFDKDRFLLHIYDEHWDQRALKDRMKHIAITLSLFLDGNFKQQVPVLVKIIEQCRADGAREQALEYMFFSEYIALFGLEDFPAAMKATEFVTAFTSCEFAIRPFLNRYLNETMARMLKWSAHKKPYVRRFASEGCRPRLPWGHAVAELKKDPAPILPILENLKCDPSEYVRRSVANNLNDIAKDHPGVVMEIATRWKGLSKETDWIIRQGSRTLLKRANPESLTMWGLSHAPKCTIKNLLLKPKSVAIDETLEFSFDLLVTEESRVKLRIEYAIEYLKANSKHSRKLFRITEHYYEPNQSYPFKRKLSFRDLTTRKHYPGAHRLSIVVNGVEMAAGQFTVVVKKMLTR